MMASAMDGSEVLNQCRQHMKKVDPAQGIQHYSSLLLDHNELARLENVETYSSLIKLSASHNQLVRMYGVARLYSLRVLNLSHNNIVGIEGLKDMKHLNVLNLAGNNIKSIEHLNSNTQLEHLDLSDNAISAVTDLSHMKGLKKLFLHANKIKTLQFCDKFLPPTLCILTVADNLLIDLNEVSRLSHLLNLEQFTLMGNPCTSDPDCNYRPFLLNWLMSLKLLDETIVNPKESLVAEWLYSQGKGRHFKIGQHDELMAYLESVRADEHVNVNGKLAEESKLDKILNLARQHQMSSLEQQAPAVVPTAVASASPVPQRRSMTKKPTVASTLARKQITPPKDAQKNKTSKAAPPYEDDIFAEPIPALMCQSLDPSTAHMALERSASATQVSQRLPRPVSTPAHPMSDDLDDADPLVGAPIKRAASAACNSGRKPLYSRNVSHEPAASRPTTSRTPKSASSKLPISSSGVPAPKSKGTAAVAAAATVSSSNHSDSNSSVSLAKPSTSSSEQWRMNEAQAAVTIQKVWRGYQTRHLDVNVREVKNRMRLNRAEDHVTHLTREMSVTRDLCQMQDQRIEALEAELRRERERGDSTSEQCRQLQRQVHDLQETMQQILDWMAYSNSPSTGGQVAPQPPIRPRTLSLTIKTAPESAPPAAQPVEDFARGMAHHLIQSSVSESGDEAKC